MQQSLSLIDSPQALSNRWASRWAALITDVSPCARQHLSSRLQDFVTLLATDRETASSADDNLLVIQAADEVFSPVLTGLPMAQTQRLGMRALAEILAESTANTADALQTWQTLVLPWLHHAFFTCSPWQRFAAVIDISELLTALVEEIQAVPARATVRLWRFIDEDSPLIEVTHQSCTATIKPVDRPDLARALYTGDSFTTGDSLIVPVRIHTTPFAVIEVLGLSSVTTDLYLHVLTVARIAEIALHRMELPGQSTNPVIWQRVLSNLAQVLAVTHSVEALLSATSNLVRQALPCERIVFWEYTNDTNEFVLRSFSARLTTRLTTVGMRCPADDTPLQVAWHTGQPLLLGSDWPERFPAYPNPGGLIHSLAVIPLVFEYRDMGMLSIERLESRPFSRHDLDWLKLVASLVAAALRNLETRQELTQARERMLEDAKMRAMGEMAAGIAHDFNNILMALMCNVELLGVATDLQQVHGRLPRLERAILDARTIVQRINKFGAQSGEEFSQVCLSHVLEDTVELMQPQLAAHRITLEVNLNPETRVMGSETELREVAVNLVANAIHAMPEGGILTLACGQQENRAWLTVRDTGVGMSPAVIHRAVEPFFSTKGGKGSGLGLSICYRIIQRHGGDVRLESEEGVGTQANIDLPGYPAQDSVQDPVENTSLQITPGHILLVEDNQEIAETLGQLLKHLGFEITLAGSAQEGIARFDEEDFNVVITDLAMHGDIGDAVAQAVRRVSPETPVLLLSGSLDLQEGCCDLYAGILHKPLNLHAIHLAIVQALSAQSAASQQR